MYNHHSARPKIAISACLLGHEVRYNGGHKASTLCRESLARHFDFVPLCPEVAIGLSTPPANQSVWWVMPQHRARLARLIVSVM